MSFEWWMLAAGANAVMVVAYATIAGFMIRGIDDGRQWRTNPIAVATAGVFVSCTIGHGFHLLHVLPPFTTLLPEEAEAARAMFSDARLVFWDALTGAVAIGYFMLRHRLAIVYSGASLNEDFLARQEQANRLQERVMARLDLAEAELEAGNGESGLKYIEEALEEGKEVITMLLGPAGRRGRFAPGALQRESPSRTVKP